MSDTATATEAAPVAATTTTTTTAPAPAAGGFMTASTPAAASPAATPPAQFFGEHIAKEGKFEEGWTENLRAAGFERLATKAALAKDEATFFKTMDEALGLIGKKAPAVAYPQPGASDEEVAHFRKAAGVPESAEAYQLKPASMPEGLEWSDEDAKAYGEIFHKHHVPQAAAQELVDRHMQSIANMALEGQERIMSKVGKFAQASEATFQKEWGDEYDTRLEANRAFVTTRFAPEELADPVLQAALSHPAIVRMVDTARRELRGASGLPGVGQEVASGSHSPRQQAFEIMAANPNWERMPELAKRINELYALDAAQVRRRTK
jgi:hypothetical protein